MTSVSEMRDGMRYQASHVRTAGAGNTGSRIINYQPSVLSKGGCTLYFYSHKIVTLSSLCTKVEINIQR